MLIIYISSVVTLIMAVLFCCGFACSGLSAAHRKVQFSISLLILIVTPDGHFSSIFPHLGVPSYVEYCELLPPFVCGQYLSAVSDVSTPILHE